MRIIHGLKNSSLKDENAVSVNIAYSPSCCFKIQKVWIYFFC